MSDDPASKDAFRWELRQRLVERLRIPWDGMGDMANQQRAAAAIAISTMMDEIEAMERSVRHLHRDYADMRTRLTEANLIAGAMQDEVERLTRERDEARREVCELQAELPAERPVLWNMARLPNDIAKQRCWDCFKENTDA